MTRIYIVGEADPLDFARHLSLNYFGLKGQHLLFANSANARDIVESNDQIELSIEGILATPKERLAILLDEPAEDQRLEWVHQGDSCVFLHTLSDPGSRIRYQASRLHPLEEAIEAYSIPLPGVGGAGITLCGTSGRAFGTVHVCEGVLRLIPYDATQAEIDRIGKLIEAVSGRSELPYK